MSKNLHVIGGSVLGALALMSVAVMPASAAASDGTDATFTLAGGSLDVDAAAGAALDDSVSGDTSITGSLGTVTVSDTRGVIGAWGMSAASTTFTGPLGSVSTGVSYNSGAGTVISGTVTPTTAGSTSITAVAPVAAGTLVSGNNSVSFSPTLAVTLPGTALADDYEGTVTTSVA